MRDNIITILVALIGSTALNTGIQAVVGRQREAATTEKTEAEAADLIQRAAAGLVQTVMDQAAANTLLHTQQQAEMLARIDSLTDHIQHLESQVARIPLLEAEIAELNRGIAVLTDQLREHGITPVFPPMPPAR